MIVFMEENDSPQKQPAKDPPEASKQPKQPGSGTGCGLLFALPFALGGFFILGLVMMELWEFQRM